jgi:hypothetical protein
VTEDLQQGRVTNAQLKEWRELSTQSAAGREDFGDQWVEMKQALPLLLDEVERLRNEVDRLRAVVSASISLRVQESRAGDDFDGVDASCVDDWRRAVDGFILGIGKTR